MLRPNPLALDGRRRAMIRAPLPRGVRKAVACLEAEPTKGWRLVELARACGIEPRALRKQSRRFVGRAPLAFLRDLRFARIRQGLSRGEAASVTDRGAMRLFPSRPLRNRVPAALW
jgi:methylphosphotriester-DNA--protein-cysteine methyltransferase